MLRGMPLLIVFALLCAAVGSAPVSSPEAETEYLIPPLPGTESSFIVYRFMLHDDMIDGSTEFYFTRAFARAQAAGADMIIIDMDTPGGEVQAALNIRNRIMESEIPIFTYIRHWAISAGALIAISTDGVIMGPSSSIGGAQPITSTGEGMSDTVNEKITSILRSEVRATLREQARQNPERWTPEELEHQILLSEAFITPPEDDIMSLTVSGEVACHAGELLTMDFEQAMREGVAMGRADSLTDAIADLGYGYAIPREVHLTWSEHLAHFLSRRIVSSILMLIMLAGIYLEFKTPGLGLPLAVACLAGFLFFFGTHMADLSSYFEVLLVLSGLILLAVEIFVIPGFGLPGIMGFVLIVSGLVMALVKLPPSDSNLEVNMIYFDSALQAVAWALVLSFGLTAVLVKYIPQTRMWKFLDLEPHSVSGVEAAIPAGTNIAKASDLVGKRGSAQTDLRPAGTMDLNGHPIDVVTRGEFIVRGTPVKVLETHGVQVIVAEDQSD